MVERKLLESKGYDVRTKNVAISWQCTLEWHNQIETFFGVTELEAIRKAVMYVAALERNYEQQQQLLRCEGCGEG